MRTIVYIDGFNLYYRMLKRSKYKWLDLHALCKEVLHESSDIIAINFYTARISSRLDPSSPKDQNTYLDALKTLPSLNIYYGRFQVTNKRMFLSQPVKFVPECKIHLNPNPKYACVVKTEEKGSDVNLSVHLVRDALTNAFDHAAIITNDTDLVEPVRIVVEEAKLPLTLVTPGDKTAEDLRKIATHIRNIRKSHLKKSQFPDSVISTDGKLFQKPGNW